MKTNLHATVGTTYGEFTVFKLLNSHTLAIFNAEGLFSSVRELNKFIIDS